jgi:hypothetical protein
LLETCDIIFFPGKDCFNVSNKTLKIVLSINRNVNFILLLLVKRYYFALKISLRFSSIHDAEIIVLDKFNYHKVIGNFFKE